jgi:hypothetical protein
MRAASASPRSLATCWPATTRAFASQPRCALALGVFFPQRTPTWAISGVGVANVARLLSRTKQPSDAAMPCPFCISAALSVPASSCDLPSPPVFGVRYNRPFSSSRRGTQKKGDAPQKKGDGKGDEAALLRGDSMYHARAALQYLAGQGA